VVREHGEYARPDGPRRDRVRAPESQSEPQYSYSRSGIIPGAHFAAISTSISEARDPRQFPIDASPYGSRLDCGLRLPGMRVTPNIVSEADLTDGVKKLAEHTS